MTGQIVKEDDINFMEEDIKGGYSNVRLLYYPNDVVGIEVDARDWERGVEMLNSIVSQLNLDDFKDDERYFNEYNKSLDRHIQWEKEQAKKEG